MNLPPGSFNPAALQAQLGAPQAHWPPMNPMMSQPHAIMGGPPTNVPPMKPMMSHPHAIMGGPPTNVPPMNPMMSQPHAIMGGPPTNVPPMNPMMSQPQAIMGAPPTNVPPMKPMMSHLHAIMGGPPTNVPPMKPMMSQPQAIMGGPQTNVPPMNPMMSQPHAILGGPPTNVPPMNPMMSQPHAIMGGPQTNVPPMNQMMLQLQAQLGQQAQTPSMDPHLAAFLAHTHGLNPGMSPGAIPQNSAMMNNAFQGVGLGAMPQQATMPPFPGLVNGPPPAPTPQQQLQMMNPFAAPRSVGDIPTFPNATPDFTQSALSQFQQTIMEQALEAIQFAAMMQQVSGFPPPHPFAINTPLQNNPSAIPLPPNAQPTMPTPNTPFFPTFPSANTGFPNAPAVNPAMAPPSQTNPFGTPLQPSSFPSFHAANTPFSSDMSRIPTLPQNSAVPGPFPFPAPLPPQIPAPNNAPLQATIATTVSPQAIPPPPAQFTSVQAQNTSLSSAASLPSSTVSFAPESLAAAVLRAATTATIVGQSSNVAPQMPSMNISHWQNSLAMQHAAAQVQSASYLTPMVDQLKGKKHKSIADERAETSTAIWISTNKKGGDGLYAEEADNRFTTYFESEFEFPGPQPKLLPLKKLAKVPKDLLWPSVLIRFPCNARLYTSYGDIQPRSTLGAYLMLERRLTVYQCNDNQLLVFMAALLRINASVNDLCGTNISKRILLDGRVLVTLNDTLGYDFVTKRVMDISAKPDVGDGHYLYEIARVLPFKDAFRTLENRKLIMAQFWRYARNKLHFVVHGFPDPHYRRHTDNFDDIIVYTPVDYYVNNGRKGLEASEIKFSSYALAFHLYRIAFCELYGLPQLLGALPFKSMTGEHQAQWKSMLYDLAPAENATNVSAPAFIPDPIPSFPPPPPPSFSSSPSPFSPADAVLDEMKDDDDDGKEDVEGESIVEEELLVEGNVNHIVQSPLVSPLVLAVSIPTAKNVPKRDTSGQPKKKRRKVSKQSSQVVNEDVAG